MLTNTGNQVRLTEITEMVTGSEVIITNVQPEETIYHPSDNFYIEKRVNIAE